MVPQRCEIGVIDTLLFACIHYLYYLPITDSIIVFCSHYHLSSLRYRWVFRPSFNKKYTLSKMVNSTITFYVNGNEVSVENPDPELTLATFLRYKREL